jgi:hypothetical protein
VYRYAAALGEQWKQMDPADRVQYEKMAKADKARYQSEIAAYVPMDAAGLEELRKVRKHMTTSKKNTKKKKKDAKKKRKVSTKKPPATVANLCARNALLVHTLYSIAKEAEAEKEGSAWWGWTAVEFS